MSAFLCNVLFQNSRLYPTHVSRHLRDCVTKILLFWVNFSLKSLLGGFTYAQNVPNMLWGEYLMKCLKKSNYILLIQLETCTGWPNFFKFESIPSLPFVAINDRKQNKCHNIVLNYKLRTLFLEFSWGRVQDIIGILKRC